MAEEQFELIEALFEKDKEHIKEEIADNIHIIWQFTAYYGISVVEILDEVERKNKRTLRRMGGKDE
jgi:NTP pyrophosphatase (non-canonical NTP hydrolase)